MISDYSAALGVGTFADWSLNIVNCNLISNQPDDRGALISDGGVGALFIHDMNGPKGTANIKIKDSIIQTTILENTFAFYDQGYLGASLTFEMINNSIYSAVNGYSDSVWWRGVYDDPWEYHFHLSTLSHGNTGTVFNN